MPDLAPADLTRATRLVDAERNRRLVMAESALAGERVMAVFRLVLVALLALSQIAVEASSSDDAPPTPWRLVAVGIYVAFWVATLRVLKSCPPKSRARHLVECFGRRGRSCSCSCSIEPRSSLLDPSSGS